MIMETINMLENGKMIKKGYDMLKKVLTGKKKSSTLVPRWYVSTSELYFFPSLSLRG